jgi:hypothetical protein
MCNGKAGASVILLTSKVEYQKLIKNIGETAIKNFMIILISLFSEENKSGMKAKIAYSLIAQATQAMKINLQLLLSI